MTLTQLAEPRTLDPTTLVNVAASNSLVGNALYGYLLADTGNGQYDYGLAKDLSTSDGGKTWMLQLRDGLTFSDGTPFDAAAVQFNWQRMQAPETLNSNRSVANAIASMSASGQVLTFTLNTPISSYPNSIVNTAMNWIAKPGA
ncbi:ABC transporter substrate-binding protein, partial [Pseudonocardia oroxyli]